MKSILGCCLLILACRSAAAQCCDHCGCRSQCRKVCRVVCEVKKVPKVTYDCECEDFCIPGPSCRTTVYDCCGNKHHVYTPTCGKVKTRTKLVKNETFQEKVTYKWVVESLCCGCCAKVERSTTAENPSGITTTIPTSAELPPASLTAFHPPVPPEEARRVPDTADAAESSNEGRPKFLGLGRILSSLSD